MTEQEIERLFDEMTEENADKIIQFYLEYMDRKFIEESKRGAFRTLAYMKKQYSMMIKIHQGILNIMLLSQEQIKKLEDSLDAIE
ncbi:MAG: hypothetical protein J6N49_01655 [Alphaproteobacteria bacterium]|nr:hypothetical protein [Alphaproteobacteria bacterium]